MDEPWTGHGMGMLALELLLLYGRKGVDDNMMVLRSLTLANSMCKICTTCKRCRISLTQLPP